MANATERLAQANIFDPILDFKLVRAARLTRQAAPTAHRIANLQHRADVVTGAYLRLMRPTVQASATRPHRVIPRCSHYSIRTARSPRPQVHLHRDHPAGPLERLRLEAPTRLARLCGIQWPLARLADDAGSCAPCLRHCGEHPASHTHERARDRSRHGSSNRSSHDRGATAGTRYVRPRGVTRYGAQRWSRRHLLNDLSGSST